MRRTKGAGAIKQTTASGEEITLHKDWTPQDPRGTTWTAAIANDIQEDLMGIQEDAGVAAAPGSHRHVLQAIKILASRNVDDYYDLQTSAENILTRERTNQIKVVGPTRLRLDVSGTRTMHTIPAEGKILGLSDLDTPPPSSTGSLFEAATDYYVYLCSGGVWKISKNRTAPRGYTSQNVRKIGGFHTLCVHVGTMPIITPLHLHPFADVLSGSILPQSVWSLNFRPASAPEGMVFDPKTGIWVDIYLGVWEDSKLKSKYARTAMSGDKGASGRQTAFHFFRFAEEYEKVNKRLPFQHEFMSAARGAPEACSCAISSQYQGSGGGTVRTQGLSESITYLSYRSISNIGCENTVGVAWQFGHLNDANSTGKMVNAYDNYVGGDNNANKGQMWDGLRALVFGGAYGHHFTGGARCVSQASPLDYSDKYKGRGVAPHRGGRG